MKRTLAATLILTALAVTQPALAQDVALRQISQTEFSHLVVGNTSRDVEAGRKVFKTDALWDGRLWSAWACDNIDDAWIEIEVPADCRPACQFWDAKLTAKGCGLCHELCLSLWVTDGCVPEVGPEPTGPCAPAIDATEFEALKLEVAKLKRQLKARDELAVKGS